MSGGYVTTAAAAGTGNENRCTVRTVSFLLFNPRLGSSPNKQTQATSHRSFLPTFMVLTTTFPFKMVTSFLV